MKRRHARRAWENPHPAGRVPAGNCHTHHKQLYHSRAQARAYAARNHPGDHLQAYCCQEIPAMWHLGHVPPAVRAGEVDKTKWLTDVANRREAT